VMSLLRRCRAIGPSTADLMRRVAGFFGS
jgi:hypothetical protein